MPLFYGWWIVAATFAISFYVGGAVFYGLTPFFEPIAREFGWSYAEISLSASIRGMEIGILAPFVGFAADRFGSRRVLLFGVFVVGLGLCLMGTTQTLTMFYTASVLLSLGAGGCASLVLLTVVAKWFSRDAGKALGLSTCGFGASGLMVPLIVWLIDAFGWRAALVTLGIGMWIIGIPLCLAIRNTPADMGLLPDGGTAPPGRAEGCGLPGAPAPAAEPRFGQSIRSRDFWILVAAETFRATAISSIITHIMPYLTSIGHERTRAGFIAALVPVLSISGRFAFGWLGDAFDKKRVVLLGYALTSLGLICFSQVHAGWFIVAFLVFFPAGYGGTLTARAALVREYFGSASFGRLVGIMMGTSAIGSVAGPWVAGFTFDRLGSYQVIWLVYFALLLGSLALVATIRRGPEGGCNSAGGPP